MVRPSENVPRYIHQMVANSAWSANLVQCEHWKLPEKQKMILDTQYVHNIEHIYEWIFSLQKLYNLLCEYFKIPWNSPK